MAWVLAAALLMAAPHAARGQTVEVREGAAGPAGAEAPPASGAPPRIEATRADGAVDVDGVLDEPVWADAAPVELAWEVSPGDNEPAPVRTVCRMAFDRERLYFGCEALEPDPDAIRAYVTDRDDIGSHDRIVVTLDPSGDRRRGFEFGVSALGVQWDAVYSPVSRQGGPGASDPSWDAIWASAGRITADGYAVEAAIPFESLRFPEGDDSRTWGFFVSRLRPRGEDVELRSVPWNRSDACVLCQAALLTGLRGVEPGGSLQLTPTLTGSRTDTRRDFPAGEMAAGEVSGEPGLDASWLVTSDLTLNATLNPDFSQVEADAPQLDVNSRFALFFPEKRPFFLEGADFFDTPLQAVFTRTIVAPSVGAKLTGKAGANAVGLLAARDRENALTLPGARASATVALPGGATNVVGRVRRDVGTSSTVGVLATVREGAGYHNRVAGADAFLRLGRGSSLRLQYLRSSTDYPAEVAAAHGQPQGRFDGHAVAASWGWRSRAWNVGFNARALTDGFRADAGFVSQVDLANAWGWVNHTWWGGDDWWTAVSVDVGGWFRRTLSGWEPLDEGVWTSASFRGPLQSLVWINPDRTRQEVDGGVHEHGRLHFGGSVRPSGAVGLRFDGTVGGAVDQANRRPARQLRLSPALDVRLGRRTDLRLTHSFQRLDHNGRRVFDATVSQLRAVYNLSSRAFVRGTVQYRRTEHRPEAYAVPVDPRSTALSTQLLFSYKVNPLSVVFVGYGDDRAGGVHPDGAQVSLTPSRRTFFLKLGYAWRP